MSKAASYSSAVLPPRSRSDDIDILWTLNRFESVKLVYLPATWKEKLVLESNQPHQGLLLTTLLGLLGVWKTIWDKSYGAARHTQIATMVGTKECFQE